MATAFQTQETNGGGGGGANGGGASKKKKNTRASEPAAGPAPAVVPTLSFPKIGKGESAIFSGASGTHAAAPGAHENSKLPPTTGGDFASFPKLREGGTVTSGSQANTRRQPRLSNAEDHPPASLAVGSHTSLPSVSPRIDASAALTAKILTGIDAKSTHPATGATGTTTDEEAAVTARRHEKEAKAAMEKEAKRASTKKKHKHSKKKKEKDQHAAASRPAAAAVDDDEDEYEYDDDRYSSPSPSANRSRSDSHAQAADSTAATPASSAAPAATPAGAASTGTAASDATSPAVAKVVPLHPRKVGPGVAFASPGVDLDSSVAEELDSSFQAPAKTPFKAKAPHPYEDDEEVEEEAGANLFDGLSPSSKHGHHHASSILDDSITDDLHVQAQNDESMSSGEETITALLANSPQGVDRRGHPTSIVGSPSASAAASSFQTTLKSPTSVAAVPKAKGSKKKAAPAPAPVQKGKHHATPATTTASSSQKKRSTGASTPASVTNAKSAASAAAATAVTAKPVPAHPSPIAEDAYADDDWRNATTNFAGGITLQRKLEDAATASGDEADSPSGHGEEDLPEEMIRFTMRESTLQELYAQHAHHASASAAAAAPAKSHTTLEFSRSQRLLRLTANGEQVAADGPPAASEGELHGETKWLPIYTTKLPMTSSLAADLATAAAPTMFTVDRSTFGTDPNESLLVQLWNNAYSDDAAADTDTSTSTPSTSGVGTTSPGSSFSRTLLAEFQTSLKEFTQYSSSLLLDRTQPVKVAPRSAMKPPAGPSATGHGDLASPSNGGGGVKHHVRFFERVEVFRLSARLDRTTELPEEKSVATPSVTAPAAAITDTELAGLIMSEQAFDRRGRASAGKVNPAAVAAAAAAASKKATVGGVAPKKPSPATAIRIHARAAGLPKMEFHRDGANAILEVHLFVDGAWRSPPLYKSECIFGSTEPAWKPFVLCAPAADSPAAAELLDAPMLLKLVHFVDHARATSTGVAAGAANGAGGVGATGADKTAAHPNDHDTIGQCLTSLRALLPPATAAAASDGAPSSPPSVPLHFRLSHPARQKLSSKRAACGDLTLHFLPPATPSTSSSASRRNSATNGTPLAVGEKEGAKQAAAAAARRKSNGSRPASKHG